MIIVEQQNVKKMLPNYIVETAEELVEPLLNGNRYDNLYVHGYNSYFIEVDDDDDYDYEQTSGILLLDVAELVEPLLNGNRYDNLYVHGYNSYFIEVDDDDDYDDDYEQTSGILLLDVTPLSLGIETNNGFTQRIIEKNSVIPTKKSILIKHNKFPVPSDP
eukprot:1036_1